MSESILDDPLYVPKRIESGINIPAESVVYRLPDDDLDERFMRVVRYPRQDDNDYVEEYSIVVDKKSYVPVTSDMVLTLGEDR